MKLTLGSSVQLSSGILYHSNWGKNILDKKALMRLPHFQGLGRSIKRHETFLPHDSDVLCVTVNITISRISLDPVSKFFSDFDPHKLIKEDILRTLSCRYAANIAGGSISGINKFLCRDGIVQVSGLSESAGNLDLGFSNSPLIEKEKNKNNEGKRVLAGLIYDSVSGASEPVSISCSYFGYMGFGAKFVPSFISETDIYTVTCTEMKGRIIALHPDEVGDGFHTVDGRIGECRCAVVPPYTLRDDTDFTETMLRVLREEPTSVEERVFVAASLVRGCSIDF
ncbi:hypothetical protein [Acetobacter persici]|uniref:Uncharacterized protein n=1 Tax=Acetobacter persici TaxID=1076596 RepID=A0A1U9LJM9_9PROT|nr:hypothetical protein [Acetobacter persici]AQT06632.1 hypothetical protein A0U91_16630 [Acetobacter persici]